MDLHLMSSKATYPNAPTYTTGKLDENRITTSTAAVLCR
jgi:hypothetical protein